MLRIKKTFLKHKGNRLEVFYMGLDDVLYHAWQYEAGTIFSPQNLLQSESNKAVAISVALNQDNGLELFYIGMGGTLYHNWQLTPGGSWHGQEKL
jgi:hypothetical protein